jgi:hypothetical protein
VGTGDHFVGVATPQVSVLGAITINTDHGTLWSGGDTALAELVAALAAHRDGIDREHLLDLIWDDQLPDAADTRLAAALERLDQLLCHARGDHTPAVVSTGSMLRFNPKAVIVDLWALDDAIDATSPDADLDNPDDAVTPAVLAEWIHDIADTFAPFAPSLAAPWAGHQRETIRRRLAAASTRWARQLAEVDHPDTVTVLRVAHTADPYNIEVGVDLLTRLTRAGADTTNAQTAATLAATWRTLLHDAGQWDGETSTLDDTARTVIEQAIHPPDATTRGASCTDGL